MSLNMTSFAAALKQHYTNWEIENLTYKDNPFLALVPKYDQFGGSVLKLPLLYGNPQNRAASFAAAQAGTTSSALSAFLITRVSDYSLASIDNQTLKASVSDANAFLKAATTEIDGALHSLSRSVAVKLYRSGTGTIAVVSSSQSGASTTISLQNGDDITNFEVGMALVASATDGGAGGTTYYVIAVDRVAGTLQISATVGGSAVTATASGFTAGTFISVYGDTGACASGLAAWLPSSVSGGDSFFGVNRSVDRVRLAGQYLSYASKPIEEALIDAAVAVARQGGRPSHIFMNHSDFGSLSKALGAKVQVVDLKAGSDGAIGFTGLQINGPRGPISVVPDFNCPSGVAYVLQLDTWQLCSLGPVPTLFDTDGLQMLRSPSADGVDIRTYAYFNLACRAPGYNAAVALTSNIG